MLKLREAWYAVKENVSLSASLSLSAPLSLSHTHTHHTHSLNFSNLSSWNQSPSLRSVRNPHLATGAASRRVSR